MRPLRRWDADAGRWAVVVVTCNLADSLVLCTTGHTDIAPGSSCLTDVTLSACTAAFLSFQVT